MNLRSLRLGLLSAFLLGWSWMVLSHSWNVTLREQESAAAGRLSTAMRLLIERAHHAQDDLAIQNTVQAVSLVPGVSWVCVTERDGRILADPEPTLLTRNIQSMPRPHPAWSFALRDPAGGWGTLWLGFSDAPLRQSAAHAQRIAAILIFMIWIGFLIHIFLSQKVRDTLEKQAVDISLLHEDQVRKLMRAQKESRENALLSERRLRILVEQFQTPAVFLDDRQRVVAVNRKMLDVVRSGDETEWIDRSWQEITCLQACGPALEESLQSPGRMIEVRDPFPQGRLYLQTHQDPGGPLIGTWVTVQEIGESAGEL